MSTSPTSLATTRICSCNVTVLTRIDQ
ncbi:hypothetical protein LINPERPRIM_LOCUS26874 [Linum perenne]